MSAVGGAGATTVAAQLSAALSLQQRDTLAFDWCQENRLRFHFGMPFDDRGGWATNFLHGREWYTAAYRSDNGLDFVPFGQLHDDAELERVTGRLKAQPAWFRNQLSLLRVPEDTVFVCDCPRTPAVLREQVMQAADLVLVVTAPDSVSYVTATGIGAAAGSARAPQTMLVLNGFDPSRQLDRDISVLLRSQSKRIFSPVVVHRDESLREALACKQTVFEFAPSSQAAYDFSALATWALARLGHVPEAA
jgi:cellulose synthase operon protein YhjQ